MSETRSMSISGSKKYDWEDWDKDKEKLNLGDSQFFQYLYERFKEKRNVIDYTILIMLLGFAVIILLLLLQWRG